MPIRISFDYLASRLTSDSLLIAPNSRTQKAIIAGYMASSSMGEVVEAPVVLSLSQWLQQLWDELSFIQPLPQLIGDLELKTLLKEQIASDDHWQLTNSLGVAEKVLEAYRNLRQWNLELADITTLETTEHQYFVTWITSLENFLQEKGLIPTFTSIHVLRRHLSKLTERLPSSIILVGFNQFTPMETEFFELLKKEGTAVETFFPNRAENHIIRLEGTDFENEIEIAAAKTKSVIEANPNQSVAVVVHQLASHISLVHQIFSGYFQPHESLPWKSLDKVLQYNVSAGEPLADMPMVKAATRILSFQSTGFDAEKLAFLKNTPFIHWGQHEGAIKRFIHRQCLLSFHKYTYPHLLKAIEETPYPEQLALLKTRLYELDNRASYQRKPAAWVNLWKDILTQWGWIHGLELNAFEEKAKGEFIDILNDFSCLGRVFDKQSETAAKDFLLQALKQKAFQIPSEQTNVHVLGVLEASGLEFDELIVVGFTRENWPQKSKLNPFLPISFQQQHQMMRSTAEKEYEYARSLSASFLKSANQVWITQSRHDDEYSPEATFFSAYPLQKNHQQRLIQRAIIKPDYIWRIDEKIDLTHGKINGGAYMLSQYAGCPFRAMSNYQFKIKSEQEVKQGIEPKIKGNWLHLAMEYLWNVLKDQQSLLAASSDEIETLVEEMVAKAKCKFEAQLNASTLPPIIDIESAKLKTQIIEWLKIDKLREPFHVQTEVDKSLILGSLNFHFRIDRVDTNEKGGIEIIDYKTGLSDFKKWLGPRPEEAQMPAYVLACQNESIHSLTYAKIKTGEIMRSGIWFSDDNNNQFLEVTADQTKDKTRKTLSNPLLEAGKPLVTQWRDNLEALAKNITLGKMPVSPKKKIDTCRYCDFCDFCRIGESQPTPRQLSEMKLKESVAKKKRVKSKYTHTTFEQGQLF